jgi:site-specific DNA-methyltransferase (adenine-specific)
MNEGILDQIWQGDCLQVMDVIEDKSVDMVLTDLPYGVTARNKWDVVIPLEPLWEQYKRVIKENGVIVLTAIQPFTSVLVISNPEMFKYEWIWEKQQGTGFLNAKKQPLRNHESVLVFYDNQPTYNPQFTKGKPYKCKSGIGSSNYGKQVSVITDSDGSRYPLTVQKFSYDGKKEHPTQKPVALFEYLIKTYTNESDTVLDSCIGSGTTAIACKMTNRHYIGIELSQEYCQIAEQRIKAYEDSLREVKP